MTIDIDKLREAMKEECLGAFFVGGFGGAILEVSAVENSPPDELIRMAKQQGIDLRKYEI